MSIISQYQQWLSRIAVCRNRSRVRSRRRHSSTSWGALFERIPPILTASLELLVAIGITLRYRDKDGDAACLFSEAVSALMLFLHAYMGSVTRCGCVERLGLARWSRSSKSCSRTSFR